MVIGICAIIVMASLVGTMVVYVIKHEDPAEFQRRADDEEQERYLAEWCEKHKGRKEPLWKRIVGGLKK